MSTSAEPLSEEDAIKKIVVRLTPRTCQECGSTNLEELVSPMPRTDVRRYFCWDCGHVSYYHDLEENWRVNSEKAGKEETQ